MVHAAARARLTEARAEFEGTRGRLPTWLRSALEGKPDRSALLGWLEDPDLASVREGTEIPSEFEASWREVREEVGRR